MAYCDPDNEQDLIDWEAEHERNGDWYTGDPRRCPRHPHVTTSSPDGMFDGLCNECEAEADDLRDEVEYLRYLNTNNGEGPQWPSDPTPAPAAPVAPRAPRDDDDIPF